MHVKTPLVFCPSLSELTHRKVYLKLDSMQTSNSFKYRGISHLAKELKEKQGKSLLVCSSGGNAGLACAKACADLGMRAHIFVPQITKVEIQEKLRALGAEVTVAGRHWAEADEAARAFIARDETSSCGYCHPFDHPSLWTGNSTVVEEIAEQMDGVAPDVIVVACGGGGLLLGTLEGVENLKKKNPLGPWSKTCVAAVETYGTHSLALSVVDGLGAQLDGIQSIATTLGATKVAEEATKKALFLDDDATVKVRVGLVSDAEAVAGARFVERLDEAGKKKVEPSCGAAVALMLRAAKNTQEDLDVHGVWRDSDSVVVVVVCGGNAATEELMQWYEQNARKPDEAVKRHLDEKLKQFNMK